MRLLNAEAHAHSRFKEPPTHLHPRPSSPRPGHRPKGTRKEKTLPVLSTPSTTRVTATSFFPGPQSTLSIPPLPPFKSPTFPQRPKQLITQIRSTTPQQPLKVLKRSVEIEPIRRRLIETEAVRRRQGSLHGRALAARGVRVEEVSDRRGVRGVGRMCLQAGVDLVVDVGAGIGPLGVRAG